MNLDILAPSEWAERAACNDAAPEMFFPEGNGSQVREQVVAAREVCDRCPMLRECAKRALETASGYGVWAGVYLGSQAGDRRIARERLQVIGGVELPPSNHGGRPKRGAFACSSCDRLLRPIGRTVEEFPGTLTHKSNGLCAGCHRAIVRAKAKAEAKAVAV